jgi:hypothetical protein
LFYLLSLLIILASHDETGRILLEATSLDASGLLAPRSTRSIAADRALTFTTTVRVIARVHDEAANGRANAEVAFLAGAADVHKVVILVADDADGRAAVAEDLADLGAGETEHDITGIGAEHLSARTSGAAHLAAFARLKFDVVDEGAIRDVLELAAVADFDIGLLRRSRSSPTLRSFGFNDVTLFAIGIEMSDEGGAVRIVFDRFDRAGMLSF